MPDYFYVTILCVVFGYIIILGIYLFNRGKYYPYLNRNKEDRSFNKIMFDIGLITVLTVSAHNLSHELANFILPLLMIALCLFVSILNYLSYAKIRDRKIIYQTVILDISIIVLILIVECIIP